MSTLAQVLAPYGLTAEETAPAGGTAGRTWRVVCGGVPNFVRRRGPRTASPERVRFDQGLRRHLAGHGFPSTPAVTADTGEPFVVLADGVYEVYPWVEGLPLTPALAERGRVPVAETLAWFHRLAAEYEAPCEARIPQFGHYPGPVAPSPRFDDPAAFAAAVEQVIQFWGTPETQPALDAVRRRIDWLAETYDPIYADLPVGVIHGDFNGCNLLFEADGRVAGVFDYDWAWRERRVRDIGEACLFFGARRDAAPDGGSIWSLTECPRFDRDSLQALLGAYHRAAPLSAAEQRAVPLALLGRWVACRTEGVMKVPEARRVEFLLADFETPFAWYEAEATALQASLSTSA